MLSEYVARRLLDELGSDVSFSQCQRKRAAETLQPLYKLVERVKGIEPSSLAWEAIALPLSYTRTVVRILARFATCWRKPMK